MKITYLLIKDDYLAFNIYQATHSPNVRGALLRQRYIYSMVFLIIPFALALVDHKSLVGLLSLCVPIWLLWTVFYPKFFLDHIERRAKRYTDQQSYKKQERHTLIINEEGIRDISPTSDKFVKWNGIEKATETANYFLFHISAHTAFIVPKRVFKTESEQKAFMKKLTEYIPVISPKLVL